MTAPNWTATRTWSVGELVTASYLNQYLKDNLDFLKQFGQPIVVTDEKSQGTAGQTLTLGAWRQRDLNSEKYDPAGLASVASNQINLAAGTYLAIVLSSQVAVGVSRLRLQNVTDGTTLVDGLSVSNSVPSFLIGKFQITGTKDVQLQQYATSTGAVGSTVSQGVETYAVVLLIRIES